MSAKYQRPGHERLLGGEGQKRPKMNHYHCEQSKIHSVKNCSKIHRFSYLDVAQQCETYVCIMFNVELRIGHVGGVLGSLRYKLEKRLRAV